MDNSVAVIGMACRFPGAVDGDSFWALMSAGIDAIREIPPDRLQVDGFDVSCYGPAVRQALRWAGLLEQVDQASDWALRNRLVPVNENIGLAEILAAADRYFDTSGRRLTFEYVLLDGLNDQAEHAHRLAALLGRRTALLNVIPFNPVAGLPYQTPSHHAVARFVDILQRAGVNIQVRERKGDKIDAACGQLRRSNLETVQLG